MSESKHTPGPWYVVDNSIYRRPKHELYEYGGGVAGDKPIAFLNKGWREGGFPVEANSRLIAAAPEMLEALIRIEKFIPSLKLEHESSMAKQIRSAIAKATGGDK